MPAVPTEFIFGHIDVTCACGHGFLLQPDSVIVHCTCGRELKVLRHAKSESKRKRATVRLFVEVSYKE